MLSILHFSEYSTSFEPKISALSNNEIAEAKEISQAH